MGWSAPQGVEILVAGLDRPAMQVIEACLPPPDYQCIWAPDSETAVELLCSSRFQLVLCDLRLPGRGGLEILQAGLALNPLAAFLMTSEPQDWSLAVEAMKRGAYDCLEKPFHPERLVRGIQEALERQQSRAEREMFLMLQEHALLERTRDLQNAVQKIEENRQAAVNLLAAMLAARESETNLHSRRVQAYSILLAERCGYDPGSRMQLNYGALLHDIGKIAIPDAVLLKQGKLTSAEIEVVRQHPVIGHRILAQVPGLEEAAGMVLSHHERMDGSGYPSGLRGEAIPLASRIFSIADTLDAIITGRVYRRPRTLADARREILRCTGTQFDPDLVGVLQAVPDEELTAARIQAGEPLTSAPQLAPPVLA